MLDLVVLFFPSLSLLCDGGLKCWVLWLPPSSATERTLENASLGKRDGSRVVGCVLLPPSDMR